MPTFSSKKEDLRLIPLYLGLTLFYLQNTLKNQIILSNFVYISTNYGKIYYPLCRYIRRERVLYVLNPKLEIDNLS